MVTVESYADRILRPHATQSGQRRGLLKYYATNHGVRPSWWHDGIVDELPEVIGVFENLGWPTVPALIICAGSIVMMGAANKTTIPYDEIVSFEPLAKSPVAEHILLHLKSGEQVRVPVVSEEEGAIFAVLRFIVDARRLVRRREAARGA